MSLPTTVRAAVLEVVRSLRDPDRVVDVPGIGYEVWARCGDQGRHTINTVVLDLRDALGVRSLRDWARGKSREEVAQALEKIATPEAEAR